MKSSLRETCPQTEVNHTRNLSYIYSARIILKAVSQLPGYIKSPRLQISRVICPDVCDLVEQLVAG